MIHGGAPAGWLEFSANMNPLGTPPLVAAAIAQASYDRYADLDPADAEEHLAQDAGVPGPCVLLTAGATEAIRLITAAFARGRRIVVLGPTYSEYARLAARAGATAVELGATPPAFDPPLPAVLERLGRGPCLLFACDPNNPTGRALDAAQLRLLASATPGGSFLALDQSFGPFAPPTLTAAELLRCGRVILVRSLTKVLAAPGIRLGYVIAAPEVIRSLRRPRDPWAVGAHAVAAARAASWALAQADRELIAGWRERLARGLEACGLHVVPGAADFLLARAGPDAAVLVRELAERRIAVRSCASFGLPEFIRATVRPPAEQDLLLDAIGAARAAAVR